MLNKKQITITIICNTISDKQVLYPSVDAFDETDHIDTLQLNNDTFFQERYYWQYKMQSSIDRGQAAPKTPDQIH
jgi:hypothetical protein